ncbi:heavy-metal-associated domain-containing protein [Chitinophaga nivalis]|uniref:Heavy-metal-associated domain-containing protein n=1 Tax=Chitinophaga nivalis TaxID=2991709 RepID=A0ABT3IQ93_9BACT|nr:heavy-metal-associated domain-containing protein [Chitinophaga nivalis]MCW3464192.1 heavy-metal-associated domain-containing protein [Chitinophaga nivalis]MCW3486118.1 heavy-metal-associated domain-containing protein [Chitinophaga nivalis]
METVQFKTNIKCAGCIATVTPVLNELAGQENWEVDLQSPDKVLTVSTDKTDKDVIRQALEKVGYKADVLG